MCWWKEFFISLFFCFTTRTTGAAASEISDDIVAKYFFKTCPVHYRPTFPLKDIFFFFYQKLMKNFLKWKLINFYKKNLSLFIKKIKIVNFFHFMSHLCDVFFISREFFWLKKLFDHRSLLLTCVLLLLQSLL